MQEALQAILSDYATQPNDKQIIERLKSLVDQHGIDYTITGNVLSLDGMRHFLQHLGYYLTPQPR